MASHTHELIPVTPGPVFPVQALRAGGAVLATGLLAMGALFLVRPQAASRVFGLPREDTALPYVRALAFRDLAVASALGLASRGPLPALGALAASLSFIPAADAALVAHRRGRRAWPSLALHGLSAAGLLALAAACGTRRP